MDCKCPKCNSNTWKEVNRAHYRGGLMVVYMACEDCGHEETVEELNE